MHNQSVYPRMWRVMLGFAALAMFGVRGAEGQPVPHELRIGLRVQQAEVRLQSALPVHVEAPKVDPLDLPADQVLVFHPAMAGMALADATGKELLTSAGPFRVTPVPPKDVPQPLPPLVKMLGPTRHYDGRPDRPYRGAMEVRAGADGLTVVNIVNVEDYLRGVVSSEMSCGFPLEALKAQAVAARTYALKHIGRFADQGYDLDDTPLSQVYGGFLSEDPQTGQAVEATAGKVLTYQGQLIDAVYSSTCGGYTESAQEAWGHSVPYLVSVPDFCGAPAGIAPRPTDEAGWATYCKTWRNLFDLQPKYARPEVFRWVRAFPRKDLEAGLPAAWQVGTLQNIVVLHRGASGRITSLRLEGSDRGVTIDTEASIRRAFGNLRSSAFTVDTYRDDAGKPVVFMLYGAGWGHGLGMCQVGATGMADAGWSYDKILAYYYQGTTLTAL